MEERASILLPGSDSESGDAAHVGRRAPPARCRVLASCVLLTAVGVTVWRVGYGGKQTEHPAAAEASIFLAEKKKEKNGKERPMDLETVKAMLEEDLGKAKQQEEDMTAQAKITTDDAEATEKEAKDDNKQAKEYRKEAQDKRLGAKGDVKKAAGMIVDSAHNTVTAEKMQKAAAKSLQKAKTKLKAANTDLAAAQEARDEAKEMARSADKQMDAAKAVEVEALEKAAAARLCFDLPGVRLEDAEGESDFAPMLVEKETGAPEQCTSWCQKHAGCAQAVFSAGDQSCRLFEKATTDVTVFSDGFNSSLCGPSDDEKDLQAMLDKAYSHQPIIPPVVDCSWDGEDCSATKCCNDEECDWEFAECKSYSCFGSGNKATCMSACYGDKCENQGTGRETREIDKAKEGVLLQATSLYCFMVVVWSTSEAKLADNAKDKGAGIYQCDEGEVIEGQETSVTEWKTYLNADMFIDVWKQVQERGTYLNHGFTVKVDADAVFFPDILKQHLDQLRTPQGSKVYIRNVEHKFQFLGPLEVLSQQALTLYFEKGWVCEKKDHDKQGEDYFLQHCLDAIGADHQTDFELLSDRVTNPSSTKLDCTNGWTAAYHWARSAKDWNDCYDDALEAQASARRLLEATHAKS